MSKKHESTLDKVVELSERRLLNTHRSGVLAVDAALKSGSLLHLNPGEGDSLEAQQYISKISHAAEAIRDTRGFTDAGILQWMKLPNRLLAGFTPREFCLFSGTDAVVEAGKCFVDPDRLGSQRIDAQFQVVDHSSTPQELFVQMLDDQEAYDETLTMLEAISPHMMTVK